MMAVALLFREYRAAGIGHGASPARRGAADIRRPVRPSRRRPAGPGADVPAGASAVCPARRPHHVGRSLPFLDHPYAFAGDDWPPLRLARVRRVRRRRPGGTDVGRLGDHAVVTNGPAGYPTRSAASTRSCSSVSVWCALGNVAGPSLFGLLHKLPIYASLRVPSRFLGPATAVLGLLAVTALMWTRSWLARRGTGPRLRARCSGRASGARRRRGARCYAD
jgi:hypothetical protein